MGILTHLISKGVSRQGDWNRVSYELCVKDFSWGGSVVLFVGLELESVSCDNVSDGYADH